MIEVKIDIPIYCGTLIIIQSDNFKDVEKKYNLTDTSKMKAFHFKNQNKNESTNYFIVFKPKEKFSIISHEIVHLLNQIFRDHGIKLSLKNDEPQAYFHSWLVEQVCDAIDNDGR